MTSPFLPINLDEIKQRGWNRPDFVLITGDAYVDHPSFGAAIIGRLLESHGYSVGMIAQPDWKKSESFQVFGEPRLGFFVTGGNIDSMVNHYSVAKKRRVSDAYSPGGATGLRPDRASIVYGNCIRALYPKAAIVLGGLEASLRRLSHYDYWDNRVRRSILLDSAADLVVYGMGEHQTVEIAQALDSGLPVGEITFVRGTVYKTKDLSRAYGAIRLPSFEEVSASRENYAKSFLQQYENTDQVKAKSLVEPYGSVYVVQNAPALALTTDEFDAAAGLPYTREYHPVYESRGGVPAIEEVRHSVISSRGCFGGCHFCALAFHQGKVVTGRSHASVIEEAEAITQRVDFKGYIHDVGGPTANFRAPACEKQLKEGSCEKRLCLFPKPCKNLKVSHEDYRRLLSRLRSIPRVKKVFIRSGIRYDYVMADPDGRFFEDLVAHHVSGQLKVAPEHVTQRVLDKMGKPGRAAYDGFVDRYRRLNQKLDKKQYLVPYFMSSHPGSDLDAAIELAEYIRDSGVMPEQVQDFYPTPGTLSTCMYYTEMDPRTMEPIYVPKNPHDKAMQRALIQYRKPVNERLVREALAQAGRKDLIGFDKKALIRPKENPSHPSLKKREEGADKKIRRKKTIRNIHKKKNDR